VEWERAFADELCRLRPHLNGASILLDQILVAAWTRWGDSDPIKAAREYDAETKA
jgi:hypothetical protein